MVTCRSGASAAGPAGGGAAEGDHPPRVLRGQHGQHDQQPGVDLARPELPGALGADLDALAVQQLCAAGLARGQVGLGRGLVGGGAAGRGRPDVDRAGAGPEAASKPGASRPTPGRAGPDATITSAAEAPEAPGGSGISRVVATPRAPSAVQTAGAQATVALLLTCPAIHVEACAWTSSGQPERRRAAPGRGAGSPPTVRGPAGSACWSDG